MTKLEEIFSIEDTPKRQKALIDYANFLKIKTKKAIKPNGQCNENYLAVLIHDAQQRRNTRILTNSSFLVAAAFLLVSVLAAIYLFVKLAKNMAGAP